MPLSPPVPRQPMHRRALVMHGYKREDGLFDIEGHLEDTKAYAFENDDRGRIEPGEALHGMWIRLTVTAEMEIVTAEAVSDFTPYAICPVAAPNFAVLAGLTIGPGFNRAVNERVGGIKGCTHLREMLGQMATVAYQTLVGQRRAKTAALVAQNKRPPQIGTCLAYAATSPVVRSRWPDWAEAPASEPAAE
ncbi:DUF2889 domain-containing protein [Humitalea sp. 24SJ18S-53]|uniref:DUF2889 domain-containing protein n=1 Tax=Humitalea sp. 24SJ18S-53 TaxID=3422307 RepID=UPI003D67453F